ncbi:MAG: LexA family protein [Ruminiclostridium sp.]
MSKLSKRLKELRNSKGLSQQALANEIGISKSSINMYERGEREPSVDTLELFADYYNVDMNYLLGNSSIPNTSLHLSEQINYPNIFPIKKHRIRLLGDIACGKPIYADEEREVYVDVGTDIKADFCLRAKGDSMINARIMDGDIVFIREQPMVNNGEIAAVIIDDEATLKRVYYYPEKQKLMLVPENTKYEPLVYIGEELEQIRILGLAVAFQSDL